MNSYIDIWEAGDWSKNTWLGFRYCAIIFRRHSVSSWHLYLSKQFFSGINLTVDWLNCMWYWSAFLPSPFNFLQFHIIKVLCLTCITRTAMRCLFHCMCIYVGIEHYFWLNLLIILNRMFGAFLKVFNFMQISIMHCNCKM